MCTLLPCFKEGKPLMQFRLQTFLRDHVEFKLYVNPHFYSAPSVFSYIPLTLLSFSLDSSHSKSYAQKCQHQALLLENLS